MKRSTEIQVTVLASLLMESILTFIVFNAIFSSYFVIGILTVIASLFFPLSIHLYNRFVMSNKWFYIPDPKEWELKYFPPTYYDGWHIAFSLGPLAREIVFYAKDTDEDES